MKLLVVPYGDKKAQSVSNELFQAVCSSVQFESAAAAPTQAATIYGVAWGTHCIMPTEAALGATNSR